jgi:hypothetical protein
MMTFLWIIALLAGVGAIVWGAEAFAEHLGKSAVALKVSSFARWHSCLPERSLKNWQQLWLRRCAVLLELLWAM